MTIFYEFLDVPILKQILSLAWANDSLDYNSMFVHHLHLMRRTTMANTYSSLIKNSENINQGDVVWDSLLNRPSTKKGLVSITQLIVTAKLPHSESFTGGGGPTSIAANVVKVILSAMTLAKLLSQNCNEERLCIFHDSLLYQNSGLALYVGHAYAHIQLASDGEGRVRLNLQVRELCEIRKLTFLNQKQICFQQPFQSTL